MTLLQDLKEYLRIDGNYEDSLLITLIESAKAYLNGAGVKLPTNFNSVDENGIKKYPLHRLAVLSLASHYYENRQIASQYAQNEVPFSVQTMILQLKWVDIDES